MEESLTKIEICLFPGHLQHLDAHVTESTDYGKEGRRGAHSEESLHCQYVAELS